jgi:EmrB/QacA subfamily drug resistance transporter
MPPAPQLSSRDRTFALAGVLLSLLLAGLDQTIVATAGPAIQRDLRIPAALYAWITTSYLVASTVMVPIYGKLSDRYGRKPVLLSGVGTFLAGSALCGLSQSALALIVSRGVQGLGAASLFTSTFAVIGDLFPPQQRGKYMGLVSATMGIASVIGPLVGGFLTDRFGWHWVFFVNLPLGLLALWFIVTRMPALRAAHLDPGATRPPIDLAGALALVVGVVPLLVAVSLGRVGHPTDGVGLAWGSWRILGMLALSVVGIVAFVLVERRAEDPIVHLEIFRNPIIGRGTATMFVLGAGFLFAVVFLPLYLVNVIGVSATRAGLTMLPLTLGMVTGSIVSGQLVARVGHYKRLMVGGLVLLIAGFALMGLTLSPTGSLAGVTLQMLLVGLGLGPTLPLYTLAIQNAARAHELGVVTSTATFSRSLGQVVGIALFGSIFAATLTARLASEHAAALAPLSGEARALASLGAPAGGAAVPSAEGGASTRSMADTAALAARIRASASPDREAALQGVRRMARGTARAFTVAVARLYQVGTLVIALALWLTLGIPERPLRSHPGGPRAPPVD